MFGHYLSLGLRSLRRNGVLTALMVCAIAAGIAAFTTTLTVVRAMANDPIPHKSLQLFVPQIDNWGPGRTGGNSTRSDRLENQLSYTDAVGLMNARQAPRQAAMYPISLALTPRNAQLKPFAVQGRATYADFFAMFEVPFKFGGPWSEEQDQQHASVVVISSELNERLFGGENGVGETLNLDGRTYRIVGVIDRWQPVPRFYDLNLNRYGEPEELFVPFTHSIEQRKESAGNDNCSSNPEPGWEGYLHSECVWIQFWVELPSAADLARYRNFLEAYAAEQRNIGRFHWPPRTQLRNVREWLVYEGAVSDEARVMFLVAVSFLGVCLLNAMGLMLAKIMGRAGDIGVRRALGAPRRAVLAQYLVEAGVVGAAGGVLGLILAGLSLQGLRALLSERLLALTYADVVDVGVAMLVATAGTILAALYPTWRATQIQPAAYLKIK